jgi:phage shock protein C
MSETPKTLYLSDTDKKLAGVCGGLAEYFGADSTIVRLIAVLIVLVSGVFPGVIVYIVMAVITPHRPVNEPPASIENQQ